MNVVLWIVQVLLAALYVMSGLAKLTRPKDKLVGKYPWMETFSQGAVRFIGVMEVLGAAGLILPAATGIVPALTPIAAAGLAVMMIVAAAVHVRRREPSGLAVTVILLALTALVVWGRFGPYAV
ncbi:DoxX family protein [Nonomuraea sp. KC401]|uniref:DoxX family protein n=1 Tax=unclassified Nonomuraea TaxID=2593643 RepID=UPI0010FE7B75|nr:MULTISPECIES: DoxX family protein [unclassified Nonomuraea]NBE93121.1 DoxX family protein [Nonomuraea sp. K271]TLF82893.1 DoxX family protein [Nonomuraea sp. KC401]